jgi:hypothetical protein
MMAQVKLRIKITNYVTWLQNLQSLQKCDGKNGNRIALPTKLDKMSNSSNFECTFCGKVNNSRQELTCHMTVHTKERDFNCTECSKSYTTTGALIYHINSVHEKLKFACPVPNCGKSLGDSYYLKHHIDRHDPESSDNSVVSCPICKQKLKKISLANHVYRHSAQKKHKCPSCDQRFQNTWALKQHQRVHLPLEKRQFHPCNLCDFKASRRCYLNLHKEVKHSLNPRSYSCTGWHEMIFSPLRSYFPKS